MQKQEIKDYIKAGAIPKRKWKYDFQIVSIAVTNKAECIYALDKDIFKFGDGFIDVRDMPDYRGAKGLFYLRNEFPRLTISK